MALILSTPLNPGSASWLSGAGAVLEQNRFGFNGSGGTILATESTAIWCASGGGDTNITVGVAPTFAGQVLTFFFTTDGGGDIVITFPAGLNSSGFTTVTMNDASDSFGAMGVTTDGVNFTWVPLFNNGCTLS